MKKDIIHIYHGSQGAGGLYIHEIYQVLKNNGVSQEAFLSYYFPFQYGKKIFFRYTDLASGIFKSKTRIFLRAIELFFGLLYTVLYIIVYRPKVVNYSLISSYLSDYIFLKILKMFSNSIIVLTCHDVVPFGENKKSILKQIKIRKKILRIADFFIVHNQNSIDDLQKLFNIPIKDIFYHPFPLMDLHKIVVVNDTNLKKEYDFSFLGHFRESKGVDLLIKAWKLFHEKYPHANLLLAGNFPNGSLLDLKDLEKFNVKLFPMYLSDEDYFNFLNRSKNIILPYKSGTNSGVLYNLIMMNVNIIYSDLPMFTSNVLLNDTGKFKTNDVNSLFEKMCEFYILKDIEIRPELNKYDENFKKIIIEVYKKIMSTNK